MAATLLLGCEGQDPITPLVSDPSNVYAALRLNHKVVVLSIHAPYNTVQLHATPISLTGDTLVATDVQFNRISVLDTTVSVDSITGLVTARSGTSGARVIATVTVGQVARADTVIIMVRTETPVRPIVRLEFSPQLPDSGWQWAGINQEVNTQSWIRLYDAMDALIPTAQALVHVEAQKREVFFAQRSIYRKDEAQAMIGETYVYARVFAYGKALEDSFLFRRIDPPVRRIVIDRIVPAAGEPTIVFFPGTLIAKAGSTVFFMNRFGTEPQHVFADLGILDCWGYFCGNRIRHVREYPNSELIWVDSVDIQFANPVLVGAGDVYGPINIKGFTSAISDGGTGNIPAFATMYCRETVFASGGNCGGLGTGQLDYGVRARKFTVPGTYHYTSSRFPGVSGTIIITE